MNTDDLLERLHLLGNDLDAGTGAAQLDGARLYAARRRRQHKILAAAGCGALAVAVAVPVVLIGGSGTAPAPAQLAASASPSDTGPAETTSSPTQSAAPSPSPSATLPADDLLAGKTLPAYTYEPTLAQEQVIDQAEVILADRCMVSRGFAAGLVPIYTGGPVPMYRRYGVTSATTAEEFGFQPDPMLLDGHPPSHETPPSLSPQEELAANGKSGENGQLLPGQPTPCNLSAAHQIEGPDPDMLYGTAEQLDYSYKSSLSDPAVIAAMASWSACMSTDGYPGVTARTSGDGYGEKSPDAAQIKQALADVSCKQSTNLVGIWFGAEQRLQDAALPALLPKLKVEEAKYQNELARARAVIAGG